jgi:hypothetical protein
MSEINNYINSERKSTYKIPKPEPRDFKGEFENFLSANEFSQQEYAALLMTAKIMVFEREKYEFLARAIGQVSRDSATPRVLHRLRRHDIL